MNILTIILLVVAAIIVLLLVIALFMKKEHYVKREIIINAPQQKVFDFLKLLKNQEQFNKWAKTDSNRKEETRGTDGTVGFIYSWSGNKSAGMGEKEIISIVEGKKIETEIRFVKPIRTSARVIMETESVSADQTKVSLSNAGTLKYPLNIMIPMVEKNFPKDMDTSLSTLKNILEKQ
ncbi:MAG TPA: SRPBCC family protein [Chitinophagaceae bacterium]|nr:SRPBCC family protein [Chitinophagaceae bacterium]